MSILDLLLFIIGMAGVAFILYAFTVIKLFNRNIQLIGVSFFILLLIVLSDRFLAPTEPWSFQDWLPRPDTESPAPAQEQLVKTGWQTLPYLALDFLLAEFDDFTTPRPPDQPPLPPSRSPSPSPSPSLSPSPSPSPSSPLPPSPFPSPSLSPSPSPSLPPARQPPAPTPLPALW